MNEPGYRRIIEALDIMRSILATQLADSVELAQTLMDED